MSKDMKDPADVSNAANRVADATVLRNPRVMGSRRTPPLTNAEGLAVARAAVGRSTKRGRR